MRHLWSLIAGVVIAPLAWAVVAFGQTVMGEIIKAGPLTGFSSKLLLAASAFVVAGIVVGLIGSLRVSPAGPLLVAVLYLGSSALLVFAPKTGLDVFDRAQKGVFGHDVLFLPPLTSGVVPIVGGALLVAVFSAGRWRAWPSAAGAADTAETTSTLSSPWTTTPVPAAGSTSDAADTTSSFSTTKTSSTSDSTASPWSTNR
jgi:hypothetical protein